VQQPHTQVRFKLGDGLAGGLRCHALGGGGASDATQLDGLGEGGDCTQFIDGHDGFSRLFGPRLATID